MSSFQYTNPQVPVNYTCSACSAHGCKLWRQYNTFLDHLKLLCVDCALKDQHESFEVAEDGYHAAYDSGRSCQIGKGSLVPAIPDEENRTFWGYTSVPQAGVSWWMRLPLRTCGRVNDATT